MSVFPVRYMQPCFSCMITSVLIRGVSDAPHLPVYPEVPEIQNDVCRNQQDICQIEPERSLQRSRPVEKDDLCGDAAQISDDYEYLEEQALAQRRSARERLVYICRP